MEMKDIGEEQFIQQLRERFAPLGKLVGIGDDCAVIPKGNGTAWLVTTDILVEKIHFLREQIPPMEAGYKAVAVNVSDIAAMGGEPKYAFLSLAVPKNLDYEWLNHLIQGIEDACADWNISLLGGDTVSSKGDIFLNLTLMGLVDESRIKYRHGACDGDRIFVTAVVGDSGGGLKMLQQGVVPTPHTQKLISAHFHPEPDPQKGRWLAAHGGVHAMMDVSDGLNCDLKRLLRASRCGGVLELSQIPLSKPLKDICAEQGWNPLEIGLVGGEDYCLLLTVASEEADAITAAFHEQFGVPLYEIGRVVEKSPGLRYERGGEAVTLDLTDFDHFYNRN